MEGLFGQNYFSAVKFCKYANHSSATVFGCQTDFIALQTDESPMIYVRILVVLTQPLDTSRNYI